MSQPEYSLSLFIFRRDLRLEDNTGLIAALKNSQSVIPCFIIDPRQCDAHPYRSVPAIQFMRESLIDLDHQLQKKHARLYLFQGEPHHIIEQLIHETPLNAVYYNRDYTPFSQKRDRAIQSICEKYQIDLHVYDDALLNPPELTLKKDETPYQVFTRFYEYTKQFPVSQPEKNRYQHYYTDTLKGTVDLEIFQKIVPTQTTTQPTQYGGRSACIKTLRALKNIKSYQHHHDIPSQHETTTLSAHLKFNTCSVREMYQTIQNTVSKQDATLILRQLYWRDFFTMIAFYFPHVFGHAFRSSYDALTWENDKTGFHAWCDGMTGFPIVDAGMRQLNQTGWMHNRARLITASFLVKDCHIDWRWGEKYFATRLMDYDPAINNGNWQWVAGTGTDAQPFFRIFNPWLQQKKFDPTCEYIKTWIPELKTLDPHIIHHWDKPIYHALAPDYPAPILDHAREAKKALELFRGKPRS